LLDRSIKHIVEIKKDYNNKKVRQNNNNNKNKDNMVEAKQSKHKKAISEMPAMKNDSKLRDKPKNVN